MRRGRITTWILAMVIAAAACSALAQDEEGPILKPNPKPKPAAAQQQPQAKVVLALAIVKQIAVPANAAANVAVNIGISKIYVSGGASGSQQVAEIDGDSWKVAVLGTGSGASVDTATNHVWAAGVYNSSVLVYDGLSRELIRTIRLGACPVGTSYDSLNGRAWVGAECGGGDDPTYAVNGRTYEVEADPVGSGGVYSGNPIANPRTGKVYLGGAPEGGQPVSLRIDPRAGFAQTANSFGLVGAVDPLRNLLFAVPAQNGKQLQIVSGGPGPETVVQTVSLPFAASFGSLAVNPVLGHLYVGNGEGNSIMVLDETTGATLATIPLGAGNTAGQLAADSLRNFPHALVGTADGPRIFVIKDGGA